MNNALSSISPRNVCTPGVAEHASQTDEATNVKQREPARAEGRAAAPPPLAHRPIDSLREYTQSLKDAAKKLFAPLEKCAETTLASQATLREDTKALLPHLKTFAKHLIDAAPALKQVGKDSAQVASGVKDIVTGFEALELSAGVAVASGGVLAPEALVVATAALYEIGKGISDYEQGIKNYPGDWKTLEPHVQQLRRDYDAMAPALQKLKADAESAGGTFRQECIRM